MELLYFCLILLFSTVLAVPITNKRAIRRMAGSLSEKGDYGIVGSQSADIAKYPYTASVLFGPRTLLGGGAILNKYWILCSAYQIIYEYPEFLNVRVGSSSADDGGQKLKVAKTILHENYDLDYAYNVAVIKTATPIKLNKMAKPVRLAKARAKPGTKAQVTGFGYTAVKAQVTGFGYTAVDATGSGDLEVATVEVKTESDCKKAHPTCGDTCLCADADKVGFYFNDYGNPLVRNKQLVGWYIGGDNCSLFGDLDVFSNVASLRGWILDKIEDNPNEEEMEGIDDDGFYTAFGEDDDAITH